MRLFDRHAKEGRCPHEETISTVNFGLERRVCLVCGKVEMQHLAEAAQGRPQAADSIRDSADR
ncbi:MAG TPA: hypothetical protein VLB85_10455 [Acidimicrobiia bacterium]|nr:hypothetical protein [Acidimicrobiia bacterium]